MVLETPLTQANIVIIVLLAIAIAFFIVVLGLLIWGLTKPNSDLVLTQDIKDIYSLLALKMYDLTDLLIEYLSDPECTSDVIEQITGNLNIIISTTTKHDPVVLRRRQLAWNNLIIALKKDQNLSETITQLSQEYFRSDQKIDQDRFQNLLYNWTEYIKMANEAKKNHNCIATGLTRRSALENSSIIAKLLVFERNR